MLSDTAFKLGPAVHRIFKKVQNQPSQNHSSSTSLCASGVKQSSCAFDVSSLNFRSFLII